MVIPPPLADLYHSASRWQTVFTATRPLIEKSVQNDTRCGKEATVWLNRLYFRPRRRVFFATPDDGSQSPPNSAGRLEHAANSTGVAVAHPRAGPKPSRLFNVR
jgi:hypothetical protein